MLTRLMHSRSLAVTDDVSFVAALPRLLPSPRCLHGPARKTATAHMSVESGHKQQVSIKTPREKPRQFLVRLRDSHFESMCLSFVRHNVYRVFTVASTTLNEPLVRRMVQASGSKRVSDLTVSFTHITSVHQNRINEPADKRNRSCFTIKDLNLDRITCP